MSTHQNAPMRSSPIGHSPSSSPPSSTRSARRFMLPQNNSMDIHDSGAGVPVVLLHAATGHSAMWQHQFAAFTAAGYRCIAFDRSAVDFASDQVTEVAAKLKLDR